VKRKERRREDGMAKRGRKGGFGRIGIGFGVEERDGRAEW